MSDERTKKMLRQYVEQSAAPAFLTGFFQSPAENFHTTEAVEFDIERDGEDVAVVVQDLSVRGRKNEHTLYTNKEFVPPIYKEEATVPANKLIERSPGQSANVEPVYAANAAQRTLNVFRKMERKIRRSIELMASQVLQEGQLTLVDSGGNSLFTMDFSPKATHFPTVSNTWGGGSDTPIADLESLADAIYVDGKSEPFRCIFGKDALVNFLSNAEVQKFLDTRRMGLGAIGRPETRGAGGKFHGEFSTGQFTFEIWSYTGFYIDPQGSTQKYVDPTKVIMLGDGRLDLTFGAVPRIGSVDARALPFLPSRMSSPGAGIDMHPNAWLNEDGSGVNLQIAARPLTIPTAIDTFGCLDTTV